MFTIWFLVFFTVAPDGQYDQMTLDVYKTKEECVAILKRATGPGLRCIGVTSHVSNPTGQFKMRSFF
jgi:hypothetical protein